MNCKKILVAGFIAVQGLAFGTGTSFAFQQVTAKTDSVKQAPENWFNLDYNKDKTRGVSTDAAYALLKDKKAKDVLVAVIDSGIDIEHEDLQGIIWVNKGEVAGNGLDDDNNGYVDDIHGWNFIGGADGKNVNYDTYEVTRLYKKLKPTYEGKEAAEVANKEEFQLYQEVKKEYETSVEKYKQQYQGFSVFYQQYQQAKKILQQALGKEEITEQDVKEEESDEEGVRIAKRVMNFAYDNGLTDKSIEEGVKYFERALKYNYNLDFNSREIVGDNYEDATQKYYGNNDVKGPDSEHGTHVAGIIAANRYNSLGVQGIADHTKIMVLRAVPNGDERDKDIANAIYYAVDNGARIINMSFGKAFSPQKDLVDKAIKYAEGKGVLIVHAAGNESKDLDTENNFPTKRFKSGDVAKNWLEVGASSWGDNKNFVGDFSNYGYKTVDVFAPGVDIYSTTPEQTYESLSGTSMAAPVTTGVAALLMAYYPGLSAEQVKNIIIKSTVKYKREKVNKPGEDEEMIKFKKLSTTGGIVNAYEAVKLAEKMTK